MKKILSLAFVAVLLIASIALVACEEEAPCLHENFVDQVVDSTCDSMGYTLHTCAQCGESYKDTYTAEHRYVEVAVIAPMCNAEGYTVKECQLCHNVIHDNVLPKDPDVHTFVYPDDYKNAEKVGTTNVISVVAPTCYDLGYTIVGCIYCDYAHNVDYVAPGHAFGEYSLVSRVQCGDWGIERANCQNCDEVSERWTQMAGHVWDNVTITLGESVETHYCDCKLHSFTEYYHDVISYELKTPEGAAKYYVVKGYKETDLDKSYVDIPLSVDEIMVTEIAGNAFMNQVDLETVYIPASVTKIGAFAFSGCTGLTTIVFEGTEEQWNAVEKLTGWDYQSGNYTVVFTK